jgi:hypothetical protein
MKSYKYLEYQVGLAGQPTLGDPGGDSINTCAQIVKGRAGDFDIRRSAEWGGGVVALIRNGKLQVLDKNMADRLFVGHFPGGISYADRHREEHGDYAQLGFLPYGTLKLQIEDTCPADLRAEIESHAAIYQAKKGEHLKVSTCGQTVLLGNQLPAEPDEEATPETEDVAVLRKQRDTLLELLDQAAATAELRLAPHLASKGVSGIVDYWLEPAKAVIADLKAASRPARKLSGSPRG